MTIRYAKYLTGYYAKKLAFPLFMLLLLAFFSWIIYIQNSNIESLRAQGKDYTVGPVTVKGEKGDRPTQEETLQAVRDYCLETGKCEGGTPTYSNVLAAVSQFCLDNTCKGRDGLPATDIQIQTQVTAFCASGVCIGAKGETGLEGKAGIDGLNGLNGADGLSPPPTVWACVLRSKETTPAVFVTKQFEAWKYSLEPDTAYRDQYEIPATQPCVNPINLTGA